MDAVCIVIPAYNEARVLRSTLKPLLGSGYTVVVVDDGSEDETWSVLERMPLFSLRHPINLGQGAALRTGVAFALRQGATIIVHFDADGQHRAEEIEELVAPLEQGKADVVLGSRFLDREAIEAIPSVRRLLLRCATVVNGVTTGLWLSDAHNGFRAMTREAAQKIVIEETGFAHASEILEKIRRARLRYVEIPTRICYSEYSLAKGQSNLDAIDTLFDVLTRKRMR